MGHYYYTLQILTIPCHGSLLYITADYNTLPMYNLLLQMRYSVACYVAAGGPPGWGPGQSGGG